ncbi:hypothetical protein CEP52_001842 [Fusarium oligoseptatum]|uniref:Clr5 domain-containing protein n=1 Tax=Fusarium oligoseptatum TaxID=2604345 RepID=A0A428UH76_9HYPO|nr:hypothetical protein CEP52_001842 [Fusarium oligoseptatum]
MPPAARIPLSLWEREKEHIRALYLDQDKTLDELVKCMAEEHGFEATRAQYIRRLDSWKMRKYSTKEEWEYVDSLVRKRKLEGKESEIIMGGKSVPVKKLKKELGRYGQPSSSEEQCSTFIDRLDPEIGTTALKEAKKSGGSLHCQVPTKSKSPPRPRHLEQCIRLQLRYCLQSALQNALLPRNFSSAMKPLDLGAKTNPTSSHQGKSSIFQSALIVIIESNAHTHQDLPTTSDLSLAIIRRDDELFEQLMSKGAKPGPPQCWLTPLCAAIRAGSLNTVLRLIKAGANVNQPARLAGVNNSSIFKTPLQVAIQNGEDRFIDLLLNSGADPNHWEEAMQLESALNTAISTQNRRVVQLLLFRGADPNKTMSLVAAVPDIGQPIDLEIFRLLLHHKADINPKMSGNATPSGCRTPRSYSSNGCL